jgi:hypothetical protein
MAIPEKFSLRLGPLVDPLEVYCKANGIQASQAVRRAVARMLKVEEPELSTGQPGQIAHREWIAKKAKKKTSK